ncbi:hypothetical protein LCGC14_0941170 [marine sediment metagenome]|uniref:Uncharacterized protein n=1 Tax=marine sediment metagenome TaxID=412755 RepID=A0A0F9P663_9ZZZZ|nr:hypothetical protein [Candidatus Aminicenantes bacterium]
MGIKFGEIDASQILQNEFRLAVLEKIVEMIANNNTPMLRIPSGDDVNGIKSAVVEDLKKKYPKSDIALM